MVYTLAHHKPFLIAESGLFDANWDPTGTGLRQALTATQQAEEKNQWISQVYSPVKLKNTFPEIKMICYFHVSKYESFSSMNHDFGTILVDWRIPTLTNYDVYNQLITDNHFLSEIVTAIPRDESGPAAPPSEYLVEWAGAYPNPFNNTTHLRFRLNKNARVRIELFDLNGKKIKTLSDTFFPSGVHGVPWHSEGASGIYYYRLVAVDNFNRAIKTGKVILVR
jgi:hypothetical protein